MAISSDQLFADLTHSSDVRRWYKACLNSTENSLAPLSLDRAIRAHVQGGCKYIFVAVTNVSPLLRSARRVAD